MPKKAVESPEVGVIDRPEPSDMGGTRTGVLRESRGLRMLTIATVSQSLVFFNTGEDWKIFLSPVNNNEQQRSPPSCLMPATENTIIGVFKHFYYT